MLMLCFTVVDTYSSSIRSINTLYAQLTNDNVQYVSLIVNKLSAKCAFIRKKTLISRDFCIRFLRPAVRMPHVEKILFTNAWLAGSHTRSCASLTRRG